MPCLGAHQSIAGNISNSLESLDKIGGQCLQIFSSSPRTWKRGQISEKDINTFKNKKKDLNVSPIFFHASYLINLADKALIGEKSVKSLTKELQLARRLEISGSIVHPGSFKNIRGDIYNFKEVDKDAYKFFLKNIETVLTKTPQDSLLILENSGTRKIGSSIDELSEIISDIKDTRLRICLDTCHLHAAGYDLSTEKKLENFLEKFDKKIGIKKLSVIHANDSKDNFASFRDRHENIGEGKIGISVFKNMLNNKNLKNIPFIIETPGFDGKGPDKKNLDILKSLFL